MELLVDNMAEDNIIWLVSLLILIVFFCLGIHNIDLAYNMERLRIADDSIDCNIFGLCGNSLDIYNLGMLIIFISLIGIFVIGFVLGYYNNSGK